MFRVKSMAFDGTATTINFAERVGWRRYGVWITRRHSVRYGLPQSLSLQWREAGKSAFRSLGVTLRGDAQPPFLLRRLGQYRPRYRPIFHSSVDIWYLSLSDAKSASAPIIEEHLAISDKHKYLISTDEWKMKGAHTHE